MSEETKELIKEIGINDIMKYLPHRYPFLLIDKVRDINPGVSATGIKNVTVNEPFFQGHFPNNPIMPGVLQIEAMAQTGGMIVIMGLPPEERTGCGVLFMTVDDCKFRKPVVPGDRLEIKVDLVRAMRGVYKFSGKVYSEEQLVSEAVFSALVIKN